MIFYLKGGEKLLLISNWKNLEKSNSVSLKLPITTYQMIINQKVINLSQLNNLILECTLPDFHSEHSQINKDYLIEHEKQQEHETEKTFIYIYDNQRLFCPPISFEIKANDQNGKRFSFNFIR